MICMIILFLFLKINYKKDENIYIEDEFKKVRNDGKITLYEKYENYQSYPLPWTHPNYRAAG